ncbi:5-amino-6-(5-phosphoribosylamino)uracil reductase [Clostridium sp. CAG:568]|nr:5-amino-6-(5-phosphoribosylamino)uracil reductase [Clostridium sp. CAG:568]
MCNEINVVIAPCADGSTKTTALFNKKRLSNYNSVDLNLIEAKVMDGGTLWVRYKVNH